MSEKLIKEELTNTTNVIKQKYRDLHKHRLNIDEKQRENYKVILDPLDEIINKNEKLLQSRQKSFLVPISNLENGRNYEILETDERHGEKRVEENSYEKPESSNNIDVNHNDSYFADHSDRTTSNFSLSLTKFDDPVYGIRKKRDSYYIGNNTVDILNGNLMIDDQTYRLTNGLKTLLLSRKPDPATYTDNDLKKYKHILQQTNVHGHKSKRYKYKNIIQPLFKQGSGLQLDYKVNNSSRPEYTYWDDPNELVERLQLLIGSTEAGHNGHGNEIISIIEELKEAKLIK